MAMSKFYCLSDDFNEQEFLEEREKTHLRTFLKEKEIVIDSILVCDRPELPYETMVFKTDSDGKVKNFAELYVENYSTFEVMQKRHNEIVNELS